MKRLFLMSMICLSMLKSALAQICGTPGIDGAANINTSINTYFPPEATSFIPLGGRSVVLKPVPPQDSYGNNFGNTPIRAGDMLLIIQMQDAQINYDNMNVYGAGRPDSGPDGLGGTGYKYLNNTGYFEYAVATNDVPLTGGTLTFRAAGLNKGTVYDYYNSPATNTRGKRTFQVVRVPQYSNLSLTSDISTPPFNGYVGGIIAFDVSGSMDFNGKKIDASSKGFRGGYGVLAGSGPNNSTIYAVPSSSTQSSGKGEGIAGTPKYMWDGYNEVAIAEEGLPGGAFGRGAPANGGGGGNDHNAGGGGGGNGGFGGVGGNGVENQGGTFPNGGRPGSVSYDVQPDIKRLVMGGGGGGGDANNAQNGVKGGVGGGLVLINVGKIRGNGTILANGGNGAIGLYGTNPDGAGGGGAGGTVFIKVSNPDPASSLIIEAKGGNGGNTPAEGGGTIKHGTGGGGGGGLVFFSIPQTSASIHLEGGKAGNSPENSGAKHGAEDGLTGKSIPYTISDLPAYLQSGGASCYPVLNTSMKILEPLNGVLPGNKIIYQVQVSNITGVGNAGSVFSKIHLPSELIYDDIQITKTGEAAINNTETTQQMENNQLIIRTGPFNIPAGDTVFLKITLKANCNSPEGTLDASAVVQYLDPTRTALDPNRLISPEINATGSENTFYESTGIPVPGSNYNGSNSDEEDVRILSLPPLSSNTLFITDSIFCDRSDADPIQGSLPLGGNGLYQYQWLQSLDGVNFDTIATATSKDYDPPQSDTTIFYRRIVRSSCNLTSLSNIIKITVGSTPVSDFQLPEVCLADASARFINLSSVRDNSALKYEWDFGDPGSGTNNFSDQKDAYHTYHQAKTYQVKLTVTSVLTGCSASAEKTFTVNGSVPQANFEIINEGLLCSSSPVQFKDLSTVDFGEITKIEWYFDADNSPLLKETDEQPSLRSDNGKMYTHQYPVFHSPMNKTIKVKMVAYSGQTCFDIKEQTISLKASPQLTFDFIPDVCSNELPFQITQAREHSNFPGQGLFSGKGVTSDGVFSPQIAGEGTHMITYTFNGDNGCTEILTQAIKVKSSPQISLNDRETILAGGSVLLTPSGNLMDNLSYQWSPAEGLNSTSILTPVASPSQDITYYLTVTNSSGCSATDSIQIKVLLTPEIPNIFTPNGDGVNDRWNIKYLETYPNPRITIYNRYGNLVYQSKNYTEGWDGKQNGRDLPEGAYYYVINIPEKRLKYSGSVTILR